MMQFSRKRTIPRFGSLFGTGLLGFSLFLFLASPSKSEDDSKSETTTETISGTGSSGSSSSSSSSTTTSTSRKKSRKNNTWMNWNGEHSYSYSTSNGYSKMERGSGKVTSEKIEVGDFTGIISETSVNIEVTLGSKTTAILDVDDNLQDHFEIEVVDGDLIVTSNGSYSTRFPPTLRVTTPSLEFAELKGSGNIEVIDFKGKEFTYTLSGSGNLILQGEVELLEIELNGSGNVDTRDCRAEEAFVNLNGSGEARVTGTRLVDARLAGSGNIHVYGKPSRVRKNELGSGNIYVH